MAIDPRSLPFQQKQYCVYLYRDPRRGKKLAPIYFGKGATATRPDLHWQHRSHNAVLNYLFAEFKANGLEPPCEYVEFFDTEDDALHLERTLINRIGRHDLGTGPLLNLSDGTVRRAEATTALSTVLTQAGEALYGRQWQPWGRMGALRWAQIVDECVG